jgi:glycosyltransferase involved in cell wall biosynthesis
MRQTILNYIAQKLHHAPLDCGSVPYLPLGIKRVRKGAEGAPLVSVITVTFNAAENLKHAIQSVAEQSYDEIEYIIIDGGSSDETLELVHEMGAYVDCLISEPDKGIYDAMNKGLLRARGQYIVLLNADDRLYPDFLTESVATLQNSDADISYCDYATEDGFINVGDINNGLLLSQLGIKHNTFVISRDCFTRVGGFDTQLKVVADAKWNRAAWAAGLRFERVPGVHVFYSLRGLSAGATADRRDQIVRESANLVLDCFPELDRNQAVALYLSNFNPHQTHKLIALHKRLGPTNPVLAEMIEGAMRWNLVNRPGYLLRAQDADRINQVVTLARYLDFPLRDLLFEEPDSELALALAAFFSTLEAARARRDERGNTICLHFARVFSSPSETFIYDFLQDLTAADDGHVHVMLCDDRKDAEGRPFDLTLHVPWDKLDARIRGYLYDLIWEVLEPRRVVAHFALNGWFLHDRLKLEQRRVEWVNMCHGIDVFVVGDDPNYTAYIDTYCAYAPNVAFTAVSEFLASLLHGRGVPDEKIFRVPNAVSDQFWGTRKTLDFWDGKRPLRLISIGRLIPWKGHDVLLHALAKVREARPDVQIDLDIVYGRWAEQLTVLEALCNGLDLPGDVKFVEFVDFRDQTDYFPSFDLFVLPSTLSNDRVPRTETFGVALIEAISAGLPVIATDAGGIPEVVGRPNPQATIVPHGDSDALAAAIVEMIDRRTEVFVDNTAYARERIDAFSAEARVRKWSRVIDWLVTPRKKIFHFCALGKGGAADAALNVHRGFLRKGYDSWFVTRSSERHHVEAYAPNVLTMVPETSVDFNHAEPPRRPEFTTFTLDDYAVSDSSLRALLADADLINLAWPGKFLSVQNIATITRLGVPVMMTLRDMNQITGGCHFFHGCTQWTQGCGSCPQAPEIAPEDFPAQVYEAKKTTWNFEAVTFVALSDHSLDVLARSPLAAGVPTVKLPNYVNTEVFYRDLTPLSEAEALASDVLKIGYLPSFGSRVKGHREFLAALRHLHQKRAELKVTILLAANDTLAPDETPYEVVKIGAIADRNKLRHFYNACDIVAVPSLEETFSNTTIEALACGVPVVGFRTGVLQEVLADGDCGAAVEMGHVMALADAILDLVDAPRDREAITARIEQAYGQQSRMDAYEAAVQDLMARPLPQPDLLEPAAATTLMALTEAQQRIKAKAMLGRLGHMRNRARQLEGELEMCSQHAAAASSAKARVAALEASTSWRITGPMRKVVTLLRSGRKGAHRA